MEAILNSIYAMPDPLPPRGAFVDIDYAVQTYSWSTGFPRSYTEGARLMHKDHLTSMCRHFGVRLIAFIVEHGDIDTIRSHPGITSTHIPFLFLPFSTSNHLLLMYLGTTHDDIRAALGDPRLHAIRVSMIFRPNHHHLHPRHFLLLALPQHNIPAVLDEALHAVSVLEGPWVPTATMAWAEAVLREQRLPLAWLPADWEGDGSGEVDSDGDTELAFSEDGIAGEGGKGGVGDEEDTEVESLGDTEEAGDDIGDTNMDDGWFTETEVERGGDGP